MEKMHGTRKCVIDIETTSFHPFQGRIICVGIKDIQTGELFIFQHDHEETMIIEFIKYFNERNFTEVIGFNVSFDIRFIVGKCLHYKIPANGFISANQVDLMEILNNYKRLNSTYRWGTLDEWSRFLLGKGKLFKSDTIPRLYAERRLAEILAYNRNDVQITFEIWQLINSVIDGESHGNN